MYSYFILIFILFLVCVYKILMFIIILIAEKDLEYKIEMYTRSGRGVCGLEIG